MSTRLNIIAANTWGPFTFSVESIDTWMAEVSPMFNVLVQLSDERQLPLRESAVVQQ